MRCLVISDHFSFLRHLSVGKLQKMQKYLFPEGDSVGLGTDWNL